MRGHPGLVRAGVIACACAATLVGAAPALAAPPATYTVTGFADGAPGTCAAPVGSTESCTTLRAAVAAAVTNGGDPTISLGAGRYVLGGAGGTNSYLNVSQPMTIAGAGPTKTTIAQTDGADPVVRANAASVQIKDLGITGGAAGGIENSNQLTLIGDLIDHNKAVDYGGGIYSSGTLTIEQSTISSNAAVGEAGANATGSGSGLGGFQSQGGGIYADGSLTMTDSAVSDNVSHAGNGGNAVNGMAGSGDNAVGGGLQDDANTLLERDTFSGNQAIGGTGGSVTGTGTPGHGNSGEGGAIDFEGPGATTSFVVVNTTITGNAATAGPDGTSPGGTPGFTYGADGGGVFFDADGHLVLADTTLDGNSASSGRPNVAMGGNFWMSGFLETPSSQSLSVIDTIIAGGTAAGSGSGPNCVLDSTPDVVDLGQNLEDSGAGTSQCDLTPAKDRLVAPGGAGVATALANNGGPTQTLALLAGSPALGAGGACKDPGNGGAALLVDQRDLPRPTGGPCDIGALQVQPVSHGSVSVTGSEVIGGTLTCMPSGFGQDVSSYTYQWSLGGTPIHGATGTSYKLTPADGGLQIFCHVVATGIRGSASATSSATAIAGYGTPSVKTGKASVSKSGATVIKVFCGGGEPCTATLTVTVKERGSAVSAAAHRGGHKARTVKLASASFTIVSGHTTAIALRLSGAALRLFKRHHGLPALATLTYWHVGKLVSSSRKLKLAPAPKHRRS